MLLLLVPACTVNRCCPPAAGKMVNFVQHPIAEKFPATVDPFKVFGNTCQHKFPATLFRFPLRTDSQAAVSKISSEVEEASLLVKAALFTGSMAGKNGSQNIIFPGCDP